MTKEEIEVELLPCPFCGEKAEFIRRGSNNPLDNNWDIGCDTEACFLFDGADFYLPKSLAIKMWNTRLAAKQDAKQ